MKATRRAERAYGILRGIVGILFACHGAQKLFGARETFSPSTLLRARMDVRHDPQS